MHLKCCEIFEILAERVIKIAAGAGVLCMLRNRSGVIFGFLTKGLKIYS